MASYTVRNAQGAKLLETTDSFQVAQLLNISQSSLANYVRQFSGEFRRRDGSTISVVGI